MVGHGIAVCFGRYKWLRILGVKLFIQAVAICGAAFTFGLMCSAKVLVTDQLEAILTRKHNYSKIEARLNIHIIELKHDKHTSSHAAYTFTAHLALLAAYHMCYWSRIHISWYLLQCHTSEYFIAQLSRALCKRGIKLAHMCFVFYCMISFT